MRRFVIHGEGLKMASLPMDAAFRHPWRRSEAGKPSRRPAGDPLAVWICLPFGGDLPIRRSPDGLTAASLPMDAAFRHPLAVIRRRPDGLTAASRPMDAAFRHPLKA